MCRFLSALFSNGNLHLIGSSSNIVKTLAIVEFECSASLTLKATKRLSFGHAKVLLAKERRKCQRGRMMLGDLLCLGLLARKSCRLAVH